MGRVASALRERHILSPAGKERWTAAAIDNLPQNAKYIPIVGIEATSERGKLSRVDHDTGKHKPARHSSGDVLSGLLICGECGRSCRRVRRASGEIVWRCANRVEHGGRVCKNSPTIMEAEFHGFLRETLGAREIVLSEAKRRWTRLSYTRMVRSKRIQAGTS